MIYIYSFFMILLMIVTVSWFIIPLCVVSYNLYHDLTRTIRWGKRFPLSDTLWSVFGLFAAFCFSAFATLGLWCDLYGNWHPETQPQRTRDVLIQVPEKVQVHTEFRLDDTVIGKEVL